MLRTLTVENLEQRQLLSISPTPLWSTFLGGSDYDIAHGVAADADGNVVVVGRTDSSTHENATNSPHGGQDAYVAKLTPAGAVIWTTFLGGSGDDWAHGVAVDADGNAVVCGPTFSSNFADAVNQPLAGRNGFVAKVSSTGSLLWATYVGGSGNDAAYGIALDGTGNAWVSGETTSSDFQLRTNTWTGGIDAFVAKVTSSGSVVQATYLGGSGDEDAIGITLDSQGNVLLGGLTNSVNLSASTNSYHFGAWDGFAAKLDPSGTQLLWTTYLGGSSDDQGYGIAVDSADNALVTGYAFSADFAGVNRASHGGGDAFVAKLDGSGSQIWATLLGGSGRDDGYGIAVDATGSAVITGWTTSSNFEGAVNSPNGDFVATVSASGSAGWAMYIGGDGSVEGQGKIAIDSEGNVLATAGTTAISLPGQTNVPHGGFDGYVVKISAGAPTTGTIRGTKWNDLDGDGTRDPGDGGLDGWRVYLDTNQNGQWDAGESSTTTGSDGGYSFTGLEPGGYRVAEVLQPGWIQTVPGGGGAYTIAVAASGDVIGVDFANQVQPGEIHGTKFNDLDGDGVQEAGEPGLVGWTIYLDTNQNGQLDSGESPTTTASDGSYSFTGLTPGTYEVAEVLPAGWDRTYPTYSRMFRNPTPAPSDVFGCVVAAAGNNVLIGAYGDDTDGTDAGAAYLFDGTTGSLLHTFLGEHDKDHFGYSTAADGNNLLVGAYGAPDRLGGAYLFDAATGTQLWKLPDPTPALGDYFGSAVALRGDYALVAAEWDNPGGMPERGAVYLYRISTRQLIRTFEPNDVAGGRKFFGKSVAFIDDNRVLIGAQCDNTQGFDAGAAYVFDYAGNQLAKLFASQGGGYFGRLVDASANDLFVAGWSRSYSFDPLTYAARKTFPTGGNVVALGPYLAALAAGGTTAANVYDPGTGGLLETYTNPSAVFSYGAAAGNDLLVGAGLDDIDGPDAGAAYLFHWGVSPRNAYKVTLAAGQVVNGKDFGSHRPTADAGGPYTGDEGTDILLSAAGSTDGAGHALTYAWDLDNDGQFDDAAGVTAVFHAGDDGTYQVAVRATDSLGAWDDDSAVVTVNNLPPVARDDTYVVAEDNVLTVSAPGVLANDADVPADVLSARPVDWDGNPNDTWTISTLAGGTAVLSVEGSFTYTPPANFNGPDSFQYRAWDDDGAHSDSATVRITVNPVNDPPVAGCGGAIGQGAFGAPMSLTAGASPFSVATADFNNDGRPDLAIANVHGASVSVLLGNGDGTFGPQMMFGVGSYPHSVAVGDLNGDGHLDLVTANAFGDSVSVLLGNGDGTFAPQQVFGVGSYPHSIAVADFNRDGHLDLVTANAFGANVSVLLGSGDGTFGAQRTFAVGAGPLAVAASDFNGDGWPDLVTANSGSDNVSLLVGNGDGTFATQRVFAVGDYPSSIAVADFNGDGRLDLVTGNNWSRNVSVLLGNGDGTFADQTTSAVGNGPRSVAVADFNGDGRTDLVTANHEGDSVSVLAGNGDGTFAAQTTFAAGAGPQAVATADFNCDGRPDLVTANWSGQDVSVLLNQIAGNAVTTDEDTAVGITLSGRDVETPAADLVYTVTVAPQHGTLSGSGRNLIYTPAPNYNGPDSFQYTVTDNGDPAGSHAHPGDLTSAPVTVRITVNPVNDRPVAGGGVIGNGAFGPPLSMGVGSQPYCVAAGDLNEDGQADLVTANWGSGTVSVLLGNGDGTFTTKATLAVGGNPWSVAVADLVGDGHLDLVTSDSYATKVTILRGNGDGTFVLDSILGAGPGPAIAADVKGDGDGKMDIVTANYSRRSVSVLLNNGDGTFAAESVFPVGGYPASVAAAYLDSDGNLDLVTANTWDDNVSVLLGNGDGTFATQRTFAVGDGPYSVAISDFDGDGKKDLVTANYSSASVSVLLGNGDGTFAAQTTYAVGNGPYSVAVADFNGDSVSDLATANAWSGTISVLAGRGDGTFAAQKSFAGAGESYSVAAADVNGDERPDLVTPGYAAGNVCVLLNQFAGNTVATDEDTPVAITLSGSDVETPAADLVYTVTDAPQHGALSGSGSNLTYTPAPNYNGPDSFQYTVTDNGDPAGSHAHPGDLTSAAATVRIDVRPVADLSGRAFEDLNANGAWDDGELALRGWTIILEGPEGGVSQCTTGFGGDYRFDNVRPGLYTLREVLQPGYMPTLPPNGQYTITVGTDDSSGLDFGNWTNYAPEITGLALAPRVADEGQEVFLTGAFQDRNPGQAHSAMVDWGDGTPASRATVTDDGATSGTIAASHFYPDNSPDRFEVSLRQFIPGTVQPSGYSSVSGVAVSPDGASVYGAYWSDTSSDPVRVYRASDGSPLDDNGPIAYGRCHADVVVSGDGRYAYATSYYEGDVSRFDLTLANTRTTIPVGRWATGLWMSPDGKTLVVNYGTASGDPGVNSTLALIDVENGNFEPVRVFPGGVPATISLGGPLLNEKSVAFSEDGKHLYVAVSPNTTGSASLVEVSLDPTDGPRVERRLDLGMNYLSGVVRVKDRLYVGDDGGQELVIVDLHSFERLPGSIDLPHAPSGIALHPDGRHLFVWYLGDDAMSVVDLAKRDVETTMPVNGPSDVVFSPDGRCAYVAQMYRCGGPFLGGISVLQITAGWTVRVTLTDSAGASDAAEASIVVNNLPPTATLSNSGPVRAHQAAWVSFTGESDPSPVDTRAGFHYSFALTPDDLAGTYEQATDPASVPFTFDAKGPETVYGRIFDKDGGYNDYQTVVQVVNTPPVAVGDAYETNEDFTLVIGAPGVLANDWDADGDRLTALAWPDHPITMIARGPFHGELTRGADGSFIYTPEPDYNGPDCFSYWAFDGIDDSDNEGIVSINVIAVNDAPTADDKVMATDEDTAERITLSGSDVETSAADLLYTVTVLPQHGTLTGSGANLTYTPAPDYNGPDSFEYTVTDNGDPAGSHANPGDLTSLPATVSITVRPVNDRPVADDKAVEADEDVPVTITLSGSDVETPAADLWYTVTVAPQHGTLTGPGPDLIYTPAPNYNGPDSFQYTVTDNGDPVGSHANPGDLTSLPATVSITVRPVNDRPVADDEAVETDEDVSVAITLSGSDVETPTDLVYTVTVAPQHGMLGGSGPNLTYTPDANYNGPDSFEYTLTDNGDPAGSHANPGDLSSAPATVTITVSPVNDRPTAGGGVIDDGAFAAPLSSGVGTRPFCVAAADLNEDGHPDLVTANWGSGTVSVLLGNGDGTFAAQTTLAVGGNPWSVAVADLVGDGHLDLVTGDSFSANVSVFQGNGDGTFAAPTTLVAGPGPAAAVDLNGDGKMDLLTANHSRNSVSVLLNNGDGTFATENTFAVGGYPASVAAADFNGDGRTDLVTANTWDDNVSVLLGNGDGTFATQNTFAVGDGPYSVAVSDLDGDGNLDLVTANYANASVSVLLGNGDGTFAAQKTFAVGNGPYSVAVADFNGDGNPDLVTANAWTGTVSVLAGQGDGTFAAQMSFAAGNESYSVADADVNGDGRVDLVRANYAANSVSVLLNQIAGNAVATGEDTSVAITLSGSDVETPAADLVYTVTVSPQHGSLGGEAPNLTYTPAPNYHGPDSFQYTVTDNGDPVGSHANPGDLTSAAATVNIVVSPVADLTGYKFQDVDGNGAWDAGEPAMAGWTIVLEGVGERVTGEDGSYRFDNVPAGTYLLHEIVQEGYAPTVPPNGEYVLDVGTADMAGLTFGNVLVRRDLSGLVFNDLDNDGVQDSGDAGIDGVTVALFRQGTAEVWTTTTSDGGQFTFHDLLPGTYTLVETQPSGYLDGDDTAGTWGGTVENVEDRIRDIVFGIGDPDATGYLFGEILPSRIQGLVWEDFNDDGEVNFGEKAIKDVDIQLTGTDDRGAVVDLIMGTDEQGIFEFTDIRPGNYTLIETQPAGYADGKDSLGMVNGVPVGDASVNDRFSGIVLPRPDSDGVNYNFGERPLADGQVQPGQTATIGFWQNKNGQALIKSLNGGPTSTQLGTWLAATFPNMYGSTEPGAVNLAGTSNAYVADLYTSLFKRTAKTSPGGPPKLDAQVLAVAFAVYVTNETLAGQAAASYGFLVTANGVGYATFDVGSANRAAFGLSEADSTVLTVLDILMRTDSKTRKGVLYDENGDGQIDSLEKILRTMANDVYTAINEQGHIS